MSQNDVYQLLLFYFCDILNFKTMEIGEIIGKNIKEFRMQWGYSQDHLAKYLGIDRSNISYYENAEREISIVQLNKLSHLFGVEIDDLLEPDSIKKGAGIAIAFRSEGVSEDDLQSISEFQRVVKNYINMKKLKSDEK